MKDEKAHIYWKIIFTGHAQPYGRHEHSQTQRFQAQSGSGKEYSAQRSTVDLWCHFTVNTNHKGNHYFSVSK